MGIVVLLIGLFLLSYSLTVVRGQSYVTIERPTFTREGGLYEYPIPGGLTGTMSTDISLNISNSLRPYFAIVPASSLGNVSASDYMNFSAVRANTSLSGYLIYDLVPPGQYCLVASIPVGNFTPPAYITVSYPVVANYEDSLMLDGLYVGVFGAIVVAIGMGLRGSRGRGE
ncbi:hypothetical protein GCM10007108_14800 [Thermogymnomonas acidicola]|uniref:Uncharacterized protein n=1 Tax=Thermogymnomonas acidicola TaxID=399579 RepID=A0AA37BSN0_9ARCH|nr:hypothetical protein GCM10007108_14800 [Thermogymnomonas acidicola]